MFKHIKYHAAQYPLKGIFYIPLNHTWYRESVEGKEGFETVGFSSGWPGDTCWLNGWIYRTPWQDNSNGTCFLLHGFCDHCGNRVDDGRKLSQQYNMTVVSYDHRYHGHSEKRFPTFGCYEAFDLQAALTMAEERGLPKPFILQGESLGAMAAQRAGIVDKRVDAMFLVAPPAWPWDAIGKNLKQLTKVGTLINAAYGWDVLNEGCVLNQQQDTDHRPLVCYAMGTRDEYDINKTKEVFNYWHNGEEGLHNQMPSQHPECRKFFHSFDNVVHPGSRGYQMWQVDEFFQLQDDFYNYVTKAG